MIAKTAVEHAKSTLNRTTVQHVLSCQVQYLKPVDKSEIKLLVEHPKVGKVNAVLRIILSQKGSPAVTGDVRSVDDSVR